MVGEVSVGVPICMLKRMGQAAEESNSGIGEVRRRKVVTAPCDLRMSFNGFWSAAQQRLGEDPRSGALCRMHGVNPYECFKDVLERLPRMTNREDLDQLMPLNWKKAREKFLQQAA